MYPKINFPTKYCESDNIRMILKRKAKSFGRKDGEREDFISLKKKEKKQILILCKILF